MLVNRVNGGEPIKGHIMYICKDCAFQSPSSKRATEHYIAPKTRYHQLSITLAEDAVRMI